MHYGNKRKNHQSIETPAYETPQSAGMDIRANLDAPIVLRPMQRVLVPTGLYIELPAGYEAQMRPRSGLAETLADSERGAGGFGHTGV